jgi:archaellum component FlaC
MAEDIVLKKLEEHDKRFDKLGNDFGGFRREMLTAQDKMMEILERLDQERIFTAAWVARIEKEVEENAKEIARIKTALKLN